MFSRILFLSLIVGLVSCASLWEKKTNVDFSKTAFVRRAWKQWKLDFDQKYSSDEEGSRYLKFIDNWRGIVEWNENPQTNWTKKLNQFGAMTQKEFKEYTKCNHGTPPKAKKLKKSQGVTAAQSANLPDTVNWVTSGDVTPIKNQGSCGSCWAFATVASTECIWSIAHGQLNSLSEQQIVDCDKNDDGCGGGNSPPALEYVINDGGLCLESAYPYKGVDGTCQSSSCGQKYDPITSYKTITPDSNSALKAAAAVGCVSVYVYAAGSAWQFYSSGVMTASCGAQTDHVVCVVGYGSDSGQDYWLVKNSWGASWGMQGYLEMCRNCNKDNGQGECGILTGPYQAVA